MELLRKALESGANLEVDLMADKAKLVWAVENHSREEWLALCEAFGADPDTVKISKGVRMED